MSTRMRSLRNHKNNKEDRISSLTDDLIHRIMSFMNTKYAVQTCVLSKRWESLWKSLPYLDFSYSTFPFKARHQGELRISFNNFITQVISRRHHTDLIKVCLLRSYSSVSILEGLISYAVDHNVQQLTIHENCNDFVWPQRLYSCKSLTSLYLTDYSLRNTINLSDFLALPALKSLHLYLFSINEDHYNPLNFSGGCLNLETLKLVTIVSEGKTLYINAPNLKRLDLGLWKLDDEEYCCDEFKVVIDAPALMTFNCEGYAPVVYSAVELASVDDVYFDIYKYEEDEDEEFVDLEGEDIESVDINRDFVLRLISTLKEFRHAKSLTLSLETAHLLAMFPSLLDENRVPFANLKYLKISIKYPELWDKVDIPGSVLNFFLNSFTKLKYCRERRLILH